MGASPHRFTPTSGPRRRGGRPFQQKPLPPITLKAGARLIREWRGVTYSVHVHDDGFEWKGKRYGSLTIIAQEITGAHWSGPRFFGLRKRQAGLRPARSLTMRKFDRPSPGLAIINCAIYTRKSSEEGLEQDFNSLDAQREACEAFIVSQRHEGWRALRDLYDDGGFSGGTMERPALQRLLADVKAGKVDIIVVYKVDRLTRSLADFAKIVEIFDAAGVSFVSVTQQFNTTTSMGRLTLNVLLSFAQFEREVTGERIRDKIAASKRKGMWMGGLPPLGYDVNERKLIVNEPKPTTVRHDLPALSELGSVRVLKADARRGGVVSKHRRAPTASPMAASRFVAGRALSDAAEPALSRRDRASRNIYPGQHEAIIDPEALASVQDSSPPIGARARWDWRRRAEPADRPDLRRGRQSLVAQPRRQEREALSLLRFRLFDYRPAI